MDYNSAERWIAANSDVAGGNWRMPTRQELKSIYQKGVGKHNRDPAFKSSGPWVWAEPYDSSSAWRFRFDFGVEDRNVRYARGPRVFGVRARPKGNFFSAQSYLMKHDDHKHGAPIPSSSQTQVSIASYFQTCAPMHENHTCSVDEVSRLISAGADVNENKGNTPLRLAIIKSLPIEFLNILITSGANVKANAQGTTLLNDVVRKYSSRFRDDGKEAREKIEILTNAGLDINTVETLGYTALMTAVLGTNIALVKMIMEAGCDVSIRNRKGQSAYDIVLERLKENEKPVNPGTPKGIVEARKRINKDLKEMAILTRFNN